MVACVSNIYIQWNCSCCCCYYYLVGVVISSVDGVWKEGRNKSSVEKTHFNFISLAFFFTIKSR